MPDLPKGANAPLTKENPGITAYTLGVEWAARDPKLEAELHCGLLLCDKQGKALPSDNLIYFNQLTEASGSAAMGADLQQLHLELSRVPAEIEHIALLLWVNTNSRQLKQLAKLQARVLRGSDGQQLVTTGNMVPGLAEERALTLLEVYRHQGEWKVRHKGEGWSEGLQGLIRAYGLK